ncbi:MAG: DMT family transporter [Spirochaetia bacterium]|nr:DMT family transporter [Spirochaetia bacterium]
MSTKNSTAQQRARKHQQKIDGGLEAKLPKLPYFKLFMAPVIWGGALVAGRVISAELPSFTTTCIRFFIASLFMVPALYLKEKRFPRPTKQDAGWILLLSLTGMVFFNYFLFSGLRTVTAVRSSVMIAFTPSVVAVLSYLLFREKIHKTAGFGIILAFIGAILTITNGDIAAVIEAGFAQGDLFLIGCVIMWALYSIIAKFAMKNLSPLSVLTYGSVLGVLLLIPFTFLEDGWARLPNLSPAAYWSLLYVSIGAAGIAYLWYYEGIKAVGSSRASVFLNMEPVAAIFLGILLLGEEMSGIIAAGALLVLTGLFLTNRRKSEAAKSS